jgi:S-adenosylmethionine synthetase
LIFQGAANRFPDSCNDNPEAAAALNVSSTRTLTSLAKAHKALLIYISTDYVFPGRPGEAPYKVTDKTSPPNIYGQTKLDGELAVLDETKAEGAKAGVILRVPLLYGHCEPEEKNKSAVHPLVDQVLKAQNAGPGDAKLQVDNWGLRFPTCTEDVGRVLEEVAELYLKGGKDLPQILQFSGQTQFTKYEMAKILAEILGAPTDNLEPHDPTKDAKEGDTQRPYDSHLDTSVLKGLGVDVSNQDFTAWW